MKILDEIIELSDRMMVSFGPFMVWHGPDQARLSGSGLTITACASQRLKKSLLESPLLSRLAIEAPDRMHNYGARQGDVTVQDCTLSKKERCHAPHFGSAESATDKIATIPLATD
jgi:hypothetical protein